jgi:hypothetical protein
MYFETAKDVLLSEVYNLQKHPFTTPPADDKNNPTLVFYHDTFSSQADKEQPIYHMQKANSALGIYLGVLMNNLCQRKSLYNELLARSSCNRNLAQVKCQANTGE